MTPARTLSTAEERREVVVAAAQHVFALKGVHGTATAEIAKAAGISHAYLFRLFPTKTDLVVAAVRASNERIYERFELAIAEAREQDLDPFDVMGMAYNELLDDRDLLLVQLHEFAAASSIPEVGEEARSFFGRLIDLIEHSTDADPERIRAFIAFGMLMNVLTAIDASSSDAHWATMLCKPQEC